MHRQIQMLRRLLVSAAPVMLFMMIAVCALSCRPDSCEERTESEKEAKEHSMVFKRIGVIRSPYTPGKETPRQGILAPCVESLIEMDSEYEEGLKDIETFSHIIVLYAFDRSSGWNPTVLTPWEKKRHGVFATRSPRRPNPIAVTVVKLIKRSGSTLHVQGLDAYDGTAVLDIKPYIPRFDRIDDAGHGWIGKR